MIARKKILVSPRMHFEAHRALFAMLAAIYPADFVGGALGAAPACDGIIAWLGTGADLAALERRGIDALAVAAAGAPVSRVSLGRAAFSAAPGVEPCFCNSVMHDHGISEIAPLARSDRDQTICWLDAMPCWTVRPVARGKLTIVALDPPAVAEADPLYRHFNRLAWLRLLPFLHFIKRLTQNADWSPPPLRACLMFDDPNLHASGYGFIDFASLARHAGAHHYHAAFAMIPADAWYFRRKTASLFREHAARLSLLMHGNDHAGPELAATCAPDAMERLLAQALRRIERFERRSGLPVARVMVPPRGAFNTQAANPMLQLGYEAVCVSRSSLAAWNQSERWGPDFGHNIVEFLGDGLPLIPRHVLAAGQEDTYRLAAFLHQPIIPHGHHRDCAGGLDLLGRTAGVINSFGKVEWMDLSALSRSNYRTRRQGETLMVQMLSRNVVLPAAAGVNKIVVWRPWMESGEGAAEEMFLCHQAGAVRLAGHQPGLTREISVSGPGSIHLEATPSTVLLPHRLPPPARRVWPLLRRLAAEGRDRLAPIVPNRPRPAAA